MKRRPPDLLATLQTQTVEGLAACGKLLGACVATADDIYLRAQMPGAVVVVLDRRCPHAMALLAEIANAVGITDSVETALDDFAGRVDEHDDDDWVAITVDRAVMIALAARLQLPVHLAMDPEDGLDTVAVSGGTCLLQSGPLPEDDDDIDPAFDDEPDTLEERYDYWIDLLAQRVAEVIRVHGHPDAMAERLPAVVSAREQLDDVSYDAELTGELPILTGIADAGSRALVVREAITTAVFEISRQRFAPTPPRDYVHRIVWIEESAAGAPKGIA